LNNPRFPWRGTLTDGKSAGLRTVEVGLEDDAIHMRDASTHAHLGAWLLESVDIESGAGATILRLKVDPAVQLTIESGELAQRIAARRSVFGQLFSHTSIATKLFLLLLVTIGGLLAIWFSAHRFSQQIAHHVPFEWEQKLAEPLVKSYVDRRCIEPGIDEMLKKLSDRLLAGVPLPDGMPREFRVIVVNETAPNAFAFPGGMIAFTRGFIAEAKSAEEVAGVLAHEMQHVIQRHVMASVVRGAMLTVVWSVLIGDYAGMILIDPSLLYTLVTAKFSRDQEAEADRGALAMLDAARISRAGKRDFFARLMAKDIRDLGRWTEMLSTHPADAKRIAMIESGMPTEGLEPALEPVDWLSLRVSCQKASSYERKTQ